MENAGLPTCFVGLSPRTGFVLPHGIDQRLLFRLPKNVYILTGMYASLRKRSIAPHTRFFGPPHFTLLVLTIKGFGLDSVSNWHPR